MLYHQTEKTKHSDRITVLKKVEDTYNWEGDNCPASFDDITTFETNSKIVASIFGHSEEKAKLTRIV